ncbi:MAG: transposase [Candidatus Melainabacteria bacterium]|nr:MAG: transposase [Candidatus Melainabacteria bacterium]
MKTRNQSSSEPRAIPFWHHQNSVPHYEAGERMQLITYRLFDSMASGTLAQFKDQIEVGADKLNPKQLVRMEAYLDKGRGSCMLRHEPVARMVSENLRHFDQTKYNLHAWVVMPNHVHVLLTPNNGVLLSQIVHSWKSYTSKKANEILNRTGDFWRRDYFDRLIRDERHYVKTVEYIHNNPVKAALCLTPGDWKFSSASIFMEQSR